MSVSKVIGFQEGDILKFKAQVISGSSPIALAYWKTVFGANADDIRFKVIRIDEDGLVLEEFGRGVKRRTAALGNHLEYAND